MKKFHATIFAVLYTAILTAQEVTYSPYALFGDSTSVLTAEPRNPHVLTIPIVMDNGIQAKAVFDFTNSLVRLFNDDGQMLVIDTLTDGQKGIWLSADPVQDKYPHVTSYSYTLGNPIRWIDLFGYEPTEKEAAYIADHVYGKSKDLIGGWNEYYKNKLPNGLQYSIYERKMSNGQYEYVLAFAGTNDMYDVGQDISQFLGAGNASQYGQAVTLANQFSSLYDGYEKTIVGHSLGGGLATVAAMVTGIPAITFNPAAITEFTKEKLSIQNSAGLNITNYIVAGDPLSMFQKGVGLKLLGTTNVIYIDASSKVPFSNSYKAHSISTFKHYLPK